MIATAARRITREEPDRNKLGLEKEAVLKKALEEMGYTVTSRFKLPDSVGTAPHGARTTVSLHIARCNDFPKGLGIDLSSQLSTGTAYQKVPFKVINAGNWDMPGAVVIAGDGGSMPAMREYAKRFAEIQPKPPFVGTPEEFLRWVEPSDL